MAGGVTLSLLLVGVVELAEADELTAAFTWSISPLVHAVGDPTLSGRTGCVTAAASPWGTDVTGIDSASARRSSCTPTA